MTPSRPFPGKVLGLAAALFLTTACATFPPAAAAQGNVGTNIPVLVVSEDEDPITLKRSSDIVKHVIAELQDAMQRHGFRTIGEEELVAADLGWEITDRRPTRLLIEALKLMGKSNKASHQVRVWVLVRIHAQAKLSFPTKVQTRINVEIYDAASNQFLDALETPRDEYPLPKDCLGNMLCITEVVGDRTREIAGGLGEVLARRLARYWPPRQSSGSGTAVTGGSAAGGGTDTGTGHGRITPYTLTLRYFDDREALTIVGVMAEEFPGVEGVDRIESSPTVRRYAYLSTATSAKIEEWLFILLRDMGFDAKSDVLVQVQGTEITVEKRIPTPNRPESPDEAKRVN